MELCQLNVDDVLVQENHGGFWVVTEFKTDRVYVANRKTGDIRTLVGLFVPDVYVEIMRGNRTIYRRSEGKR